MYRELRFSTLPHTAELRITTMGNDGVKDVSMAKGAEGDTEDIRSFLSGRDVLVTGATGFVGKALLEKILRSCLHVGTVFLLIRPSRGNNVETRKKELLSSQVLSRALREQPDCTSKVVAVEGDLSCVNLGMSQEWWDRLQRTVSVIFHVGASVRMSDPLLEAARVNLGSVHHLVNLARGMPHLRAFVYVSTAYCNHDSPDKPMVKEKVYPSPCSPTLMLNLMDTCNQEQMEMVLPRLRGQKSNTYVLTKSVTENYLQEACIAYGLPVAIVRPSIVVSSLSEPEAGWVESLSGSPAMMAAASQGVMNSVLLDPNKLADFVPVDHLANSLFAVSLRLHHLANSQITWEKPLVLHVTSGTVNPLSFGQFLRIAWSHASDMPSEDLILPPWPVYHATKIGYQLHRFFAQLLPSMFFDIAKFQFRLLRIQSRLHIMSCLCAPFVTDDWLFETSQMNDLWQWLSPQDRALFPFHPSLINWDTHIKDYVAGVRRFILRQNPSTIPAARKRLARIRTILWSTAICCVLMIVGVVINKTQ